MTSKKDLKKIIEAAKKANKLYPKKTGNTRTEARKWLAILKSEL